MHIAIVDDDKYFLYILKKELLILFNNCQIDCYENINDNLYKKQYDILFLDVMLQEVKSFEFGHEINIKYPHTILIYISSIEHFVYESYRQNTFFFMRKSQLHKDLLDFKEKYDNIKHKENNVLSIMVRRNMVDILQCDILYIQSHRNQITVNTISNKYITYTPLKKTIEMLNENTFYQLNSFTIINLNHVLKINEKSIMMIDNKEIMFTRYSKDKFMKVYMEFRRKQLWNG